MSATAGAGTADAGTASSVASSSGGSAFDCTGDATPPATVDVPAGDFPMGCNSAVDMDCTDDEKPLHTVTLSAFKIDRTEVTQAQYAACVSAGACNAPSCAWDCAKTDKPGDLPVAERCQGLLHLGWRSTPSEAEWEKAARGKDGNKYPWGNTEPDCTLTNMAGCGDAAQPVGSLSAGASPYGALDMAGNVVEIVADWYDAAYYASSPSSDPTGPSSGTRYGGRGGGFKSEAVWQRASKRDWYDLTDKGAALGFRCAL